MFSAKVMNMTHEKFCAGPETVYSVLRQFVPMIDRSILYRKISCINHIQDLYKSYLEKGKQDLYTGFYRTDIGMKKNWQHYGVSGKVCIVP
jgi:hypothetical protein